MRQQPGDLGVNDRLKFPGRWGRGRQQPQGALGHVASKFVAVHVRKNLIPAPARLSLRGPLPDVAILRDYGQPKRAAHPLLLQVGPLGIAQPRPPPAVVVAGDGVGDALGVLAPRGLLQLKNRRHAVGQVNIAGVDPELRRHGILDGLHLGDHPRLGHKGRRGAGHGGRLAHAAQQFTLAHVGGRRKSPGPIHQHPQPRGAPAAGGDAVGLPILHGHRHALALADAEIGKLRPRRAGFFQDFLD